MRNTLSNSGRWALIILVAACCLVIAVPCARAETRIALIIGNSNYASAPLKLGNPVNDAAAMQRALKSAGFETIVKLNARRLDFYRALDDFAARIGRDPASVGLFYYAGHGVQADGVNYLIPVDAQIETTGELEAEAFDVGRVLRVMQNAQNAVNIVILDACRDNPLRKTRSMSRGLARMDAPSGTFIAYAAGPGQTAQDGSSGGNGVFTAELIKAMDESGVMLEQMFKQVIAGVRTGTHGSQQPWSESSLQGYFYFHQPSAPTTSRGDGDAKQGELAYWSTIKNSGSPDDFHAYLNRYPQGEFADLAAYRLKLLEPHPLAAPASSTPARSAAVQPPAASPAAPSRVSALAKCWNWKSGLFNSACRDAQGNQPPKKASSGPRCSSLLEQVQLGKPLSDEDGAYVKEQCQ